MKTVAQQREEARARGENPDTLPPTCKNPPRDEIPRHHYQASKKKGVLWECTECPRGIIYMSK